MGEQAAAYQDELAERRKLAQTTLQQHANDAPWLRQKVERAAAQDTSLRCALPQSEALTTRAPLPALPPALTLLAADGSQIDPDRHAPVQYCLINVGKITYRYGVSQPPTPQIQSQLLYDEALYTPAGNLTNAIVALRRDLFERKALEELAAAALGEAAPIVLAITDGPIELWGSKEESGEFERSLEEYLASLRRLQRMGVANAGYVDKPGADLVMRLLEVALLPDTELPNIRKHHPLRGVTDLEIFQKMLAPGERSAIFGIHTPMAERYDDGLALRFFYLNVGREKAHYLARVEIPAWVAASPQRLDSLQAVLVDQCRILGESAYPYLLHRAHEIAVVTLEEKDQLTQMILLELQRRGVPVGQASHKQSLKILRGRMRR
jgi:hypothetical protein